MEGTFDLTERPWILCRLRDGSTVSLGLLDLFLRAPEIEGIVGGDPLEEGALYRFLVVVAHRILQGPVSSAQWEDLWDRGAFDPPGVREYFRVWKDRFDLFHREFPFFQHPGCGDVEANSATVMAHSLASGNNAVLFDHHEDGVSVRWSPATAARKLLVAQGYSLGGLGPSYKGSRQQFYQAPLVPGALVILRGDNLFQTVMLNLLVLGKDHPLPGSGSASDLPLWEQDPRPFRPGEERVPKGYLDYMTWQARLVQILPEEGGTVTRVRWIQGVRTPDIGTGEPMMVFRRQEAKAGKAKPGSPEWFPLRFSEGRACWRDSAALAAPVKDQTDRYRPPETLLALVNDHRDHPGVPQVVRVNLYGLLADKAKPLLWRKESLPIPVAYLAEDRWYLALEQALLLAEEVASRSLGWGLRLAADDLEDPLRKEAKEAFAQWARNTVQTSYWASLEVPFYRLFLAGNPATLPQEDLESRWRRQLGRSARSAFHQVGGALEGKSEGLRAWARGKQGLDGSLYRLLGDDAKEG